jgi:hypothetical protein
MANNIQTALGTTLATDEVSGAHYSLIKIAHGEEDSATRVSAASPLPAREPGLVATVLGDGAADTTNEDITVPVGTRSLEFFNLSDVVIWLSWTAAAGGVGTTGWIPVPAMSLGVAGYYAAPTGMSGTLRVRAASGSSKAYTCIRGA